MEYEDDLRISPNSDIDFNYLTTNPVWGKSEINQELKDKLSRFYLEKGKDGKDVLTKSGLWGLLGFYTRDMRLGNLSDQELVVCRYMIDLANDLLASDMIEPFLIALSRAVTILETSQSKDGFLRTKMNTLRQEHLNQNIEPPKKGFFGGSKNNNNGGQY